MGGPLSTGVAGGLYAGVLDGTRSEHYSARQAVVPYGGRGAPGGRGGPGVEVKKSLSFGSRSL